jgi:hypothetical protein
MEIPIRKIFLLLLTFIGFLLLMHLFAEDLSWTIHHSNRFNLDAEANIPTWYTTILLFFISICSLIIYVLRTTVIVQESNWDSFWILVSAVYCFLSLDEGARLHELIDHYTSIKWVYVYAPFGAVFFFICTFYLFTIRKDNNQLRNWFIGGLIFYAIGGLFAEFLSHYFYPLPPILQQVEFISEEGLEMFGTVMVLMACFTELNILMQTKIKIIERSVLNSA